MSKAKFVIKKSKDKKHYFILEAPNGETVATSEMYESKQGCKNGIYAVITYSNNAVIIDETILETGKEVRQ